MSSKVNTSSTWIKTPKCGGTSIATILNDAPAVSRRPRQRGPGHAPVRIVINGRIEAAIAWNPKAFNASYKFAFVRNPFDRIVSSYFYCLKEGWFCDDFKQFVKTPFDNLSPVACRHAQPLTLHLSSHKLEYRSSCYRFYPNQSDLKLGYLDFIGRFENLQQDFNIVCDKIGIPREQLPHKNKSKHKHYTEYYDDEIRELVAEKYKKDIEYFGYEFGN